MTKKSSKSNQSINQLPLFKADANPTKDFFISMLVKDIELSRAILDLVDNSVDGALRLRQSTGDFNFEGLKIEINLDQKEFRISDNCGGIPLETAKRYAFRFGRPEDIDATPNSIGRFGVGMKRALFKVGQQFSVESKTSEDRFIVEVDVEEWKQQTEWNFLIRVLDKSTSSSSTGTTIVVTKLHEVVSDQFGLEIFKAQLRQELSRAYTLYLQKGLRIFLGSDEIKGESIQLRASKDLKPAHRINKASDGSLPNPKVQIIAGVDVSNPDLAGWYLFCNQRLVLGPDQTKITGWGETGATKIPKYHNQFARFRGYVFFESDDPSKLPWNTTKTGVDADSSVYKEAKQQMIQVARPVIDFLNALDAETSDTTNDLQAIVDDAQTVTDITKLPVNRNFRFPNDSGDSPQKVKLVSISYKQPEYIFDKVKESLGVATAREVGELTFEYYSRMECGD